ncbi:protein tamozhennic [Trichonephila clavata]|uniref:Protein tamozhennic n=1 Tax=Trichonephila clavata TaxID=2740835 RepID=A0A8X6IKU8_TRICU|nr:protein tamozhennic [Trichonephila clavata]
MTFQAHDGHNARSEDLHRHILRSHLAYLNQEETPAKLQHRHSLESLITEFLGTVSHGSKFTFFEVAKILNESIENNRNFSAYKAGSAFEALEKYATNLISHPWRKEYKTIKLYSGFYKHSVESQLFEGGSVLALLGYQFSDDSVLFLDEPVDPDKVARVALDCLIAYVECQIMVQICERVKSFKCSWFEISQVRQDYTCGVEEAVRILHQLKRNAAEQEKQDRWLREQENGSFIEDKTFRKPEPDSGYQKTGILVDVSNTWPSNNTYPGYSSSALVLQPSLAGGSYSSKSHKSSQLTHSKLPSWSEGVSSQIGDYPSRSFLSKSDGTDSYSNHCLDDHTQSNYNFLSKCNNSDARFMNTDSTPDSWKDSWDFLQPQPPYHNLRDSSFLNCERDSHRTGYNNPVPNVKETYSTQFGHMYPPHPMMPLGLPAYPLPHDYTIPPRLCQWQVCCDHQVPTLPHKYHFPKEASGNDFESTRRSSGRAESNHVDDPGELCSSLLKMSVDTPNPPVKSRHFPVTSTYSYQTNTTPSNDVILRPTAGSKSQQNTTKRGSYYDNVPSSFDGEVNSSFNLAGQSLTPKCDLQLNGALPSTLPTKSRNQKGTVAADSACNTMSSKPVLKKSYSTSSSNPVTEQVQGSTVVSGTDSKNGKPLSGATQKDAKGGKKWSCSSCTYYNAPEKSICDMCGRSKHPGPEVTPLVSGGRECPQCTLVNKKDCEDCTACGASLKDSPTYI